MKAPKPFHLPFRFVTVCFSIKFKEKIFETRGPYFFWRRDEKSKTKLLGKAKKSKEIVCRNDKEKEKSSFVNQRKVSRI